jgi:acyl-CoA synthetase (AMP-forming)/AMP-acid ligase II
MNDHRIGWFAVRAAERWPDAEFAAFDGRRVTFGEFGAWVDRLAGDLVTRGVRPGDRVLVQLPNCLEVIALQLATWRIAATAVPVVPIYRERELRQIVSDARPAAVATTEWLGSRALRSELETALDAAGVVPRARYLLEDDRDGWTGIPSLDAQAVPDVQLPEPAVADECCLILYTSGTTSAPKGAMLSSAALIAATGAWDRLALTADDVALGIAPLAHIAGMVPSCLVPMTIGCRVAIMPRWDPAVAVETIDREHATFSTGANVFLKDMVDQYESRESRELHKLHYFVSGGSATPPELIERAHAMGLGAVRAYGMTETAGVIAMSEHDAPLGRKANFDGHLLDTVEMQARDEAGTVLAPGVNGSLWIRGPQLLLGYTDSRLNELQFDAEGWFDPGDVGSIDADRWLRITGRTKDIINRGGEKFSARDIEESVLRHAAIADASVIPIPDERFGEAVCAFVVVRDGAAPPSGQTLAEFMFASGIAKAKVPVEWHFIDRIPTTATGKVKKFELAKLRGQVPHQQGAPR